MKKPILLLLLFTGLANYSNAQWQQTNGPWGGYVGALSVLGSNLYAVTGEGLKVSTNNGNNWTGLKTGLSGPFLISGSDFYYGSYSQAYVSRDSGVSWTAMTNGLPVSSNDVRFITAMGANIFIGINTTKSVYLSQDRGNSWKPVTTGLPSIVITSMTSIGTKIFAGTSYYGVYVSSDTGAHWSAVNIGLTNQVVLSLTAVGSKLYAGTTQDSGVYVSNNNGLNWARISSGISCNNVWTIGEYGTTLLAATDNGIFKSVNNGGIWTVANNGLTNFDVRAFVNIGSKIFTATNGGGVFLSADTGQNWTSVSTGLEYIPIYELVSSGSNIYAVTDNGPCLSTDNGTSWKFISNGLTQDIIYKDQVNTILAKGTKIFAGRSLDGVYLSTDSGANWTGVNNGLGDSSIHALAQSGSYIFAGTDAGGVYRTGNEGGNWTAENTGLSGVTVSSLAVSGTNIFAETENGIFMSPDNGASWTGVNNGLQGVQYPGGLTAIGSYVFLGTYGYGIYLTTDNGANWKGVNNGIADSAVGSLVAIGSNIFASADTTTYLSTDSGAHWTSINTGLPNNTSIAGLATNGAYIFGGTNQYGVWKRPMTDILPCNANFSIAPDPTQLHHYLITDNSFGQAPLRYYWTWGDGSHDTIPYASHTYADTGYYNICVTTTDLTGCQSTFCSNSFQARKTENLMVYVRVINPLLTGTETINSPAPETIIYPNPTSDQLSIHSTFFQDEAVTVSLMNVTGQVIREEKLNGSSEISINIRLLPSGIYFLQMKSGRGGVVKKFVKE